MERGIIKDKVNNYWGYSGKGFGKVLGFRSRLKRIEVGVIKNIGERILTEIEFLKFFSYVINFINCKGFILDFKNGEK